MVFEEAPSSDRRSIPAVSQPSRERSPESSSGWAPILLAGLLVTAVLAVVHAPRADAMPAGAFGELERPRPLIITEAARRPALSAPGRRERAETAAVVPGSAVVRIHGAPTVFVSEADYRFVATPVVLGEAVADGQQVLSGVAAGQVVVTEGAEALKARLVVQ